MKKKISPAVITLWANRAVALIVFALLFALPPLLDAYAKIRILLPQERAATLVAFYICAAITYLLPLAKAEEQTRASMIFEPDEATVLEQVIPLFVAGRLMACVRESVASEVAARRVAMDSADKNAQEMLASLQLEYNRARQGSITQEITEIVAGSNA